jgi:hypothetical protein
MKKFISFFIIMFFIYGAAFSLNAKENTLNYGIREAGLKSVKVNPAAFAKIVVKIIGNNNKIIEKHNVRTDKRGISSLVLNHKKNNIKRMDLLIYPNSKSAISGGPFAQSISNLDDYIISIKPLIKIILRLNYIPANKNMNKSSGVLKGGFAVSGRSNT